MKLSEGIRRRRMCRNFKPDPVLPDLIDHLLDLARRAPSAGFTQGVEFVVLEGPAETQSYWDITLAPEHREGFPWPGLLRAPVLVIPLVDPGAYVDRYGEPDKARTGLGEGIEAWSVPYWWVDGGMVVQNLLLLAMEADLGALFFGIFDHETALLDALEVEPRKRALGTVALGYPADTDRPSQSTERGRRPAIDVIRRT